jgi:hypothetical protein
MASGCADFDLGLRGGLACLTVAVQVDEVVVEEVSLRMRYHVCRCSSLLAV